MGEDFVFSLYLIDGYFYVIGNMGIKQIKSFPYIDKEYAKARLIEYVEKGIHHDKLFREQRNRQAV
jgi:hypothetical protein